MNSIKIMIYLNLKKIIVTLVFIIDINGEPLFLTRNNAPIKVIIVKLNDRYAIIKPSIQSFNDNINEIN